MEDVKKILKERVTADRYAHVLRVSELAQHFAERSGVSVHDAEQAALLHDIAKCMDKELLQHLLREGHGDVRLLDFHHELWHGPVGAMIAKTEFGVDNEDVLRAIRYHTTGRAHMSTLEQIIFVADLIEPGRDFPGVDRLREIAAHSIEEAMKASIGHTIDYLVSKRVAIFPDAFDCYNDHMLK